MDDLSEFFSGDTTGKVAGELEALSTVPEGIKEASTSGLADLDWLDVDEQAYRELDKLPKQNLDIAPELAAQWNHEDKSPLAYFVPNRDMAGYPGDPRVPRTPNTMGDLSQLHGPMRLEPEPLMKMARLTLMESTDLSRWTERMLSKFSKDELLANKTALSSVLAERGLVGGYYIDAADFSNCSTSETPAKFAKKHASTALFVKAKSACGDCTHAAGGRCGVFHKQLVSDIPYTNDLASKVAQDQGARGFTASTEGDPKARIQSAYLKGGASKQVDFSGQSNQGAIIPASRLLRKAANVQEDEQKVAEAKARPIVSLLRREMLKGRSAEEIVKAARMAFDPRDLKATQQFWAPLLKEAGLYGAVYSTQESFADCHEGADFLSKHGSKVRAIVAGDKCSSCIYNKVGSCMLYGRKLVASTEDVITDATVAAVLDEHKMAGKISPYLVGQKWGSDPREALKNIHKTATTGAPIDRIQQPRMDVQGGYYGTSRAHVASDQAKREIVKVASQYLNEGLYGEDLNRAMHARFDPRDLVAAAGDLREVLAEQGLQGIFFVDPTVYDDYGQGCHTAQAKHRSRQAIKYAKVGDKCSSCIHQKMAGVCSVLNKQLVHEVPYLDKVAQQNAVLASGTTNQLDLVSIVNGSTNILQEFEMTGSTGNIDLNAEAAPTDTSSIEFGSNEMDLLGTNKLL